jgi:hypothetical protein
MNREEYLVLLINTLTENKTSLDYPLSAINPRFDTDLSEIVISMIKEWGDSNGRYVAEKLINGESVITDSDLRFKKYMRETINVKINEN